MIIYLTCGTWHRYAMAIPVTKKKATRRSASMTRDRILSAAQRLFAERGFDRASMPEIAKASRITAGAIYKHFASKDDLFFEVVRRVVDASELPSTDLPQVVSAYTSRELTLLRRVAVEIHHASTAHPKVRNMLRRSIDTQIEQLRDGIRDAQRQGGAAPDLDAELLANAAMVFILGLMHMETLAPQLVGNAAWGAFVEGRMKALLGG